MASRGSVGRSPGSVVAAARPPAQASPWRASSRSETIYPLSRRGAAPLRIGVTHGHAPAQESAVWDDLAYEGEKLTEYADGAARDLSSDVADTPYARAAVMCDSEAYRAR